MVQPRVSVITIFLDPGDFLAEAIASVLSQSHGDLEYLLVDDGSAPHSTGIARGASASDPRVRYLEHPGHANLGMSRSRNAGLREARGEFVAFLDADDVWVPGALERQVAWLDRHPSAQMVIGATSVWRSWTPNGGDDEQRSMGRTALIEPPTLAVERLHQRYVAPSINAALSRRPAVEDVGGFEDDFTGLYEDQAFLFKFFLAHPVVVHEELIDRYRKHAESATARSIASGQLNYSAPNPPMQTFRRFALDVVASGPWRDTVVHRDARWLYRWDRWPKLSRYLYVFRPGFLRREPPRVPGRLRRAPRQLRTRVGTVRPYLASRFVTRSSRLRLAGEELVAALPGIGPREVELRLIDRGRVYVRTDTLAIDTETLDYSLSGRYFPADVRGRVVLDLGAHKGFVAVWCLLNGARAVYSLEPETNNHRCLAKASVPDVSHDWVKERRAVGADDGRARLQISTESWSHSLYEPPSGTVLRTEEVEVISFNRVLDRARREHPGRELVIKLNVEGMAGDCLLSVGADAFWDVHELFVDMETNTPQSLAMICAHLEAAGFVPTGARDGVWHFERPDIGRRDSQ